VPVLVGRGENKGWGERVCSTPILATTEASSGGVLEGRVEQGLGVRRVVHRSWLPPRQARRGAGDVKASAVVRLPRSPPRQARRGARGDAVADFALSGDVFVRRHETLALEAMNAFACFNWAVVELVASFASDRECREPCRLPLPRGHRVY
jgi:hypothetical protein